MKKVYHVAAKSGLQCIAGAALLLCTMLLAMHNNVLARFAESVYGYRQKTDSAAVSVSNRGASAKTGDKTPPAFKKQLSFIENKGQVVDQERHYRQDIDFALAADQGLNIFIGGGALHYQFSKTIFRGNKKPVEFKNHLELDSLTADSVSMYRMDVELIGANKDAKPEALEPQSYFERYYTATVAERGAVAHSFSRIVYKDIYPHIDWVLYTNAGKLKHEFHVHAGGRVSDIKLKYGGAEKLSLDNAGTLTASTPMGNVVEQAPISYTADGKRVLSAFHMRGQTISYSVQPYAGDLIIDPTLEWATYFGGSGFDFLQGIACQGGAIYTVGSTVSSSGIATTGAHKAVLSSGDPGDVLLAAFSANGDLDWATYFGGADNDAGRAITIDDLSNIYITGSTLSAGGISTPGAFQVSNAGDMDAFVARFDPLGALTWSTYYGGDTMDAARGIGVDEGSIYLCGETMSDGGIASPGGYQTMRGGTRDAFVARFSTAGDRLWGSYIGGAGQEYGYGICTGNGRVCLGGMTSSASGVALAGAYQSAFGGGPHDGFLTMFDSNGSVLNSTYFGGEGFDAIEAVAFFHGSFFVAGATTSTLAISSPGAHQSHISGAGDGFVAKIGADGATMWSTYFGGTGGENILALALNNQGELFITGTTSSTSGLATEDAYQSAYGGSFYDIFLAKLDTTGSSLFWSTYYGGAEWDYGYALCISGDGNPILAGHSTTTSGLATVGAHQTLSAGFYDGLLVSFDFSVVPIIDSISPVHAHPAQQVTVFGKNFSPVLSQNIVHFGATQAVVNAATDSTLVVTVPIGATFEAVTVLNPASGRTAYAPKSFLPTYDNSPYEPGVINFDTAVNFLPPTDTTSLVQIADLDGDGKTDMIAARKPGFGSPTPQRFLLYRNTASPGSVSPSSFETYVDITIPSTHGSGRFLLFDIDGDGLKDIVGGTDYVTTDTVRSIYILRNTSVPGSLSFDSAVFVPADDLDQVACEDIDGDGRPELIVTRTNRVSLFKNRCTPGSIHSSMFAAPVDFMCQARNVATGDLDGDGRRDVVVMDLTPFPGNITILRNIATPGLINTASLATPVLVPFVEGYTDNLVIEDIDSDGKPDIMTIDTYGPATRFSVYKNLFVPGSTLVPGSFSAPVSATLPFFGGRCVLADIDGDARPDVMGSSPVGNFVLRNLSLPGFIDSTFLAPPAFTLGGGYAAPIADGDIDGDGLTDICVSVPFSGTLLVFRNNPLRRLSGMRLCPGDNITMTSNVRGGTWSSADPAVAVIDPVTGGLLALAPGTAVITYTINTGFTSAVVTVDPTLCTSTGVITTVAGSGAGPLGGLGGPATAARIGHAVAVKRDGAGNIYLANDASRIFVVTSDGTLHPLAGNGLPGYTGDGGPATSALIGTVAHLALDGQGNLYFTDKAYHCVRKVSHTGVITTVAGNGTAGFSVDGTPAGASQLTSPSGIAVDNSGRIFFWENGRVRMVDPFSANVLITVAGDGSCPAGGDGTAATAAAICDGEGIAIDAGGRIVLASPASIRQVDDLGFISTIAGTGANGFAGDGGPATAAELDMPGGVSYHTAGSLLVADNRNHRIRRFIPGGDITTIAGDGSPAFNGDGCAATATSLNRPADVFADAWGKVYIADYENYRVRVISGNHIVQFAHGPSQSLTVATGSISMLDTVLSVVDGDNQQPLTWSVIHAPVNGTLMATGTQPGNGGVCYPVGFNYTPTGGFSGYDSFTVRVADCAGADDTTTVYVTVTSDVPIVYSVSPNPARPGELVIISGLNFNPSATQDIVYFGATRAVVSMASNDTIIATVPVGATYQSVSVTNAANGLTGSSPLQFLPTFDNSPFVPAVVNFDTVVSYDLGFAVSDVAAGDIDGDGKADLVCVSPYNSGYRIHGWRSNAMPGPFHDLSFSLTLRLNTKDGVAPHQVALKDLDGDGKLDIIVSGESASTNYFSVFRNISVAGVIDSTSFEQRVDVPTGTGVRTYGLASEDLNNDGKPDIVCFNTASSTACVFRNNCTPGHIDSVSFEQKVVLAAPAAPFSVDIRDIDGDGRRDIVALSLPGTVLMLWQNLGNGPLLDSASFDSVFTMSLGGTTAYVPVLPNVMIGDLNEDQRPDIIVPRTLGTSLSVLENVSTPGPISASGFLAPLELPSGGYGSGSAISDFDGDGLPDLSSTRRAPGFIRLFRNAGTSGMITSSSFVPGVDFPVPDYACRMIAQDLDGDGLTDIAVTDNFVGSYVSSLSFLRNDPLQYITGTPAVCVGSATTLLDGTHFGKWQSSNTAIASVDSVTGLVTGIAPGTAMISYVVRGGQTTVVFTVDPLPAAGSIAGASIVCAAMPTSLANPVTGGTWSVADAAVGAVDATGTFTGHSGGNTVVSYTLANSCGSAFATHAMTVNPLPDTGTLEGSSVLCLGASVLFSDTTLGGTWSSTHPSVASIDATGLVTALSAGTTIISYTTTNGCGMLAATRLVTVTPTPDAGTIAGPATVCVGSLATLSASAPGGTWSSTVPSRAVINALGRVVGLSAGTTIISYALNNGCGIAYTSRLLTVVTPGVIGISGPSSVCTGADITLSSATVGGTWSSPSATISVDAVSGVVSGLSAGTGIVTYRVVNGCGTFVATKAVTVNQSPYAGVVTGAGQVCAGSSVVHYNAVAGGVWSSSDVGVATAISPGLVSGVAAGTAVVSYTVSNICGSNAAVRVVTVNPLPDAGIVSGPAMVCPGSSVTLSSSVPGGTWSSGNASVAAINAGGMVSGIAPGTAIVSYQVGVTCGTDVAAKVVTVSPFPFAGVISGPSTVCEAAVATFSSPVPAGTWSSSHASVADVSLSGDVAGITPGSARISYSVTNMCGTAVSTVNVVVMPLPAAGLISGPTSVCAGAFTMLSVSSFGGVWSSSAPLVASVSAAGQASGNNAGTCLISYSVSNGCGVAVATHAFTVHPLSPAGFIVGPPAVCMGDTASFTNAVSGGIWSSSHAAVAAVSSAGVVSAVAVGTALISYTTTNICGSVSVTKLVSVSPVPAPVTGPDTFCEGTEVYLSCITPGGVFAGGTGVASLYNLGGGNARLVANDPGTVAIRYLKAGCYSEKVVTVLALPVVGPVSGAPSACPGSVVTFSVSGTGGTWISGNPAVLAIDALGSGTALSAGTAAVTYSVTNSCGTAGSSRYITVYPFPDPGTISGPAAVCAGGGTLSLVHTGIGSIWSSSNSSVATVTAPGIVTGVNAGIVTISYTVSNACGTVFATKEVTVQPLPDAGILAGATSVCTGGTASFTSSTPGGTWTSESAAVAAVDPSTGTISGVAPGAVYISYSVSNGCGSSLRRKVVTVNPLPDAGVISGTPTLCVGNVTPLGHAPYPGTWSSGNSAVASVSAIGVVTGVAPGTAAVSYTVVNACGTDVAAIQVTVNSLPAPGLSPAALTLCPGVSAVLLPVTPAGTWTSADHSVASVSSSGIVTAVGPGMATVSYRVSNGCGTVSSAVPVTVLAPPNAGAILGTATVCRGSTVTLANPAGGGVWSSASAAVVAVSTGGVLSGVSAGTTTISYTVTNVCGSLSATRLVTVNPAPGVISGPAGLCQGTSATFSCVAPGGAWATSSGAVSIDAAGFASAVAAGNCTVSYTLPEGCFSTLPVSVFVQPAGTAGALRLCEGSEHALIPVPADASGAWTSGAAAIASFSGWLVSGMSAGTATVSYTTSHGCSLSVVVTVEPKPAPVTGPGDVCEGVSQAYFSATPGGTWVSSSPAVLSIGLVSGIAHAASSGTATIAYTVGACKSHLPVTVNRMPAPIAGSLDVCEGAVTFLDNLRHGGVWSSADPSAADFVYPSGNLRGVAVGTTTVSYSLGPCAVTAVATVNTLPQWVEGDSVICRGAAGILSSATTGGTWVGGGLLTVQPLSGLFHGIAAGTATVTYVLPTGCSRTKSVTVNPLPGTIVGTLALCEGDETVLSASGIGTWSSSSASVAAINAAGRVVAAAEGTTTVSYILPSGCSASATVSVHPLAASVAVADGICVGGMSPVTGLPLGGTWTVDRPGIAGVLPGDMLGGISPGVAVVSYWLHPSCPVTDTVEVLALPTAISGKLAMCELSTAIVYSSPSGGTWSASGSTISISPDGVVSGLSAGTSLVTYTSAAGCSRAAAVTVHPLPLPISGPATMCNGETALYTSSAASGLWHSSAPEVLTIEASSGLAQGLAAGSAVLSYTLATGCYTVMDAEVLVAPAPIQGPGSLCEGASVKLSNVYKGGLWSAGSGPATVDVYGVVVGNAPGTSVITYTLHNGCAVSAAISVDALPATPFITGNTSLCVGDTILLSATPPGGTWVTSEPSVLEAISGDRFVGLLLGQAPVYYHVQNACGEKMTSATVVVQRMPWAGSITGPRSVCMGETALFSSSAKGGYWMSAHTHIGAIAGNGTFYPSRPGTGLVAYIVTNACGADTAVYAIPVLGTDECDTTRRVITEFNLYPNPSSGAFIFESPVAGTLSVFAADGKLVGRFSVSSWVTPISLPVSLQKGVYLCTFVGYQGSTFVAKLVVTP